MQSDPSINPIAVHASAAEAAQQALGEAAASFEHWRELLMQNDDPVAVHKARVALRRFRICLKGFDHIIDADTLESLQDLARTHFRILSQVRDRDVLAENFAQHAEAETLHHDAAEALLKARQRLKKKRADRFLHQVSKKMGGSSWQRRGKKAKVALAAPIAVLASNALHRAWKDCMSNGVDLAVLSPRALHELRKDLKSLRYLSEIFSELWSDPAVEGFLRLLRRLQDSLGALTDLMIAETYGLTVQNERKRQPWLEKATEGWANLQDAPKWWDQATRSPLAQVLHDAGS